MLRALARRVDGEDEATNSGRNRLRKTVSVKAISGECPRTVGYLAIGWDIAFWYGPPQVWSPPSGSSTPSDLAPE